MMRTILVILALLAMASSARAEPVKLSDKQLDKVVAGAFDNLNLTIYAPVTVNVFTRGKNNPTKINVALSFPFTLVNSTTTSSSFGIAGGGFGGFGILTPGIGSAALSQVLGRSVSNILQQ